MSANEKSRRAASGDCLGSLGLALRSAPSSPPDAERAAGHELKIPVQIQVAADKAPPDDVAEQMNKILGGINKGMKLE